MRTGRLGAIVSATALAAAGLSGPASGASLDQELRHLLETHPRLEASRKAVTAADEGITEARSGYFPNVRFSGEAGPEYVDSPTRRDTHDRAFDGTRKSSTLTVTQNLFEGYRTTGETRIARFQREAAEQNYRIAEQTALIEGIGAYVNILRQTRLLAIAHDNEETLQRQLNLETARVARGSGLSVDVLQAKARLQLARERVVTFEGQLREVRSSYLEIFGRPPNPVAMTLPTPPLDILPKTQEGAESIAASENVVLKRSETRIKIAEQRRTVAQHTYWPRLDLVGEGSLEKDVDGIAGVRREGRVVVRAVWDIFDGFLTPARSGRAAAEYGAALDTRRVEDRDVRDRVRRAWERFRTAGRQKELLANAVNIAAEVFDARQKLRLRGRETVINVLDAENELNTARLRLTAAQFDHVLAAYQLLLQIGRLTPEQLKLSR